MKTILVAEDEFDLLSAIRMVLEDEGYHVLTASNGRDALRSLKESKPDLVITDLMMPHVSGLEVLEEMARDPLLQHVSTILMSAVRPTAESDRVGARFLPKPFTIEQLISVVGQALRTAG